MIDLILIAHSVWRWLVFGLMLITAIKMVAGWLGKQTWTALDTNLLLSTRVAVYIQVLLGFTAWILLQYWSNMRFTAEHVVMALVAVGGLEFGAARAKKAAESVSKFKWAAIGFGIALILILVATTIVGGPFASKWL
jgi:hypothetical protein